MVGCFISHAWGNEGHHFAMDLSKALKGKKIRVWIDEEQMPPGTPILDTIRRGIEHESDVFVFVLSPEALRSRMCKLELVAALHQMDEFGKPIIAVLFKECKVPKCLKGILYADFRSPQDFDNALERLIQGIKNSARIRKMCDGLGDHPDPEKRSRISEKLGELKNPLALGPLKNRLLGDEFDGTVKHWIALAIGEIGGTKAVAILEQALGETDLQARSGVILGMASALEALNEKEFNQATSILCGAINSGSAQERLCAVEILARLKRKNARIESVLYNLINDSDENIRAIIKEHLKTKKRRVL